MFINYALEKTGVHPVFKISKSTFNENGVDLIRLLVSLGFSTSNSEARRLISQGAVRLNGNKIEDFMIQDLNSGDVIQAGKLKYSRIKLED